MYTFCLCQCLFIGWQRGGTGEVSANKRLSAKSTKSKRKDPGPVVTAPLSAIYSFQKSNQNHIKARNGDYIYHKKSIWRPVYLLLYVIYHLTWLSINLFT